MTPVAHGRCESCHAPNTPGWRVCPDCGHDRGADDGSRRLRQERDLLYLTLERLVGLKDGPRDYAYRAARVDAWESARRALGMTNQEGK